MKQTSAVVMWVLAAAGAAAQPLKPEGRAALEARDWAGLRERLAPLGDGAKGESGYWLAVSRLHLGDERGAAKAFSRLWKESPSDKALTIAMLDHGELGTVQRLSLKDVPLARVDEEVCAAFIRAKARLVQFTLSQGSSTWQGAAQSIADELLSAYQVYGAIAERRDPLVTRWAGFAARLRGNPIALALLEEASAALPACWDMELDRAIALMQAGYEAEAREAYARAKALAPAQRANDYGAPSRRADCALGWGKAMHELKRFGEAVGAFREALSMHGDLANVRHRLGLAAFEGGDIPTALAAFADALSVESQAETVMYLGFCWYELGEFAVARALLEDALEQIKKGEQRPSGQLYFVLGKAQWGAGDRAAAIKNLEAAFRADLRSLDRARWLLQAHLAMEDPWAAIDVAGRFGSQRNPEHNRMREEAIAEVLKRYPMALLSDRAKGRSMPHTTLAVSIRAQVAFVNMRFTEALEQMRQIGGLAPMRANTAAAWALLQTGDVEGAERMAAGAVKLAGENERRLDEARVCHATILMLQKQPERALEVVKPVKAVGAVSRRNAIQLYGALALGKKPEKGLLTGFNALGIVEPPESEFYLHEVFVVLPGSPLAGLEPPLRPGDLVDIELAEDPWRAVADLHRAPFPTGKATLVVRRGGAAIRLPVDFTEVARRAGAEAPKAATSEKKP